MSTYYGLHCKTDDASSPHWYKLNTILEDVVEFWPLIKPLLNVSEWIEVKVTSESAGPPGVIDWMQAHGDHDLELQDEYGIRLDLDTHTSEPEPTPNPITTPEIVAAMRMIEKWASEVGPMIVQAADNARAQLEAAQQAGYRYGGGRDPGAYGYEKAALERFSALSQLLPSQRYEQRLVSEPVDIEPPRTTYVGPVGPPPLVANCPKCGCPLSNDWPGGIRGYWCNNCQWSAKGYWH